jgi:hypothetical protein
VDQEGWLYPGNSGAIIMILPEWIGETKIGDEM